MSNKPNFAKRAAKAAVFTVGGGIALIALSDTASADEVTVQDAEVTNAGVGVANSGGNVAVGNASNNTAATGQAAAGGIASNQASTSNESNGTASIETGDATATGNKSETQVEQHADSGNGGPGVVVTVQDSDVTNAGIGIANTGLNGAVGNASNNTAVTGQLAVGLLASNSAETSNTSDGSASIKTGDATATGNESKTGVLQKMHADPNAGLAVVWQQSDVDNVGIGIANSGGNLAAGNLSTNTGVTLQGAFGLLASNQASTKNSSNGSVGIVTGDATATGNKSQTDIEQSADVDPAVGPVVVVQNAPVLNAGIGIANSGGNVGVANASQNHAVVVQVSFGLLASNSSSVDNWSDGFLMIVSGDATGVGNDSSTTVKQDA